MALYWTKTLFSMRWYASNVGCLADNTQRKLFSWVRESDSCVKTERKKNNEIESHHEAGILCNGRAFTSAVRPVRRWRWRLSLCSACVTMCVSICHKFDGFRSGFPKSGGPRAGSSPSLARSILVVGWALRWRNRAARLANVFFSSATLLSVIPSLPCCWKRLSLRRTAVRGCGMDMQIVVKVRLQSSPLIHRQDQIFLSPEKPLFCMCVFFYPMYSLSSNRFLSPSWRKSSLSRPLGSVSLAHDNQLVNPFTKYRRVAD